MFNKNKDKQKNEVINQGNHRYSMLLLALLFIGMATYGTYAYFTDSTSVNGNVKLSTGTVKFDELNDKFSVWTYGIIDENQAVENKNIVIENENSFANLQSGDAYKKVYNIKYEGSLPANIKSEVNSKIADTIKNSGFNYTISYDIQRDNNSIVNENSSFLDGTITVQPRDIITITLTVSVPFNENSENYNQGNLNTNQSTNTLDLSDLENATTLTVNQLKK